MPPKLQLKTPLELLNYYQKLLKEDIRDEETWYPGLAGDCNVVSFAGDDITGVCRTNSGIRQRVISESRNALHSLAESVAFTIITIEELLTAERKGKEVDFSTRMSGLKLSIENLLGKLLDYPRDVLPCESCDGSGIRLNAEPSVIFMGKNAPNEDEMVIERCDTCGRFEDDLAAANAFFFLVREVESTDNFHHVLVQKSSTRK